VRSQDSVLVLGGTGFLGSHFVRALGKRAVVHSTGVCNSESNPPQMLFKKNQLDEMKAFLEKQNCRTIINCIALADIEKCELDPELADWINCELPGHLSSISKSLDSKFVHISTDAVFDGSTSYRRETDFPAPLSVYGKTKWNGEQSVMGNNHEAIVARVNFFGQSENKNSIFNFFYESLKSGKSVSGFADLYFTPLYAIHLVNAITELLNLNASGLFHVVGTERISKYDFGVLVAETFGFSTIHLKADSVMGKEGSIIRSSDLSLSNDKIKSLGINLPSVRDGLSILKKNMI
jgi:dTDP-4-dehydrorhamnose reductase